MKNSTKRRFIQVAAAAIMNGYVAGFMKGKIYKGNLKTACLPVLNCYSCPGAVGSCPIGSLQTILSGRKHKISFYILGFLMLFGVLFGRLICGFLCPFGFIQDIIYKIPFPKIRLSKKIDNPLRYLKYAVLLFLVFLMPIFIRDEFGSGTTYFCKLICPAGTLEGGFPLLIKDESLRMAAGALFKWKVFILAVILLLSIIIYRPFCKYLCPLGAFYSLFNKVSFYQLSIDKNKCTGCKQCEKNCKMGVNITKDINSPECIRCGECMDICSSHAITIKSNILIKKDIKCSKNKSVEM